MKSLGLLLLVFFACNLMPHAQTYNHPSTGLQGTYSGGCPVATNSGNYYDPGGSAANYANNINNVYQIFCPATTGQCMRVTFNSFFTENCCDYLTIGNGPAQNSTLFTTAPADAMGRLRGSIAAVPFSYTANNSSGCLSLRFYSDFITNRPGWAATFSTVPCAVATAPGNSDCTGATQICSNTAFNDLSPGPGANAADGCTGCVTGETYSNWYFFQVGTSGTLSLTIAPNSGSDDLDFAIYGPNVGCANLGSPIRCSYAAGSGSTGMQTLSIDNSEDVNGDSWVAPLNVTAGQIYALMVNNWTAGGAGFNLTWGGTATFNCTPLATKLSSFEGYLENGKNYLHWETEYLKNSNYFLIERTQDGEKWENIGTLSGPVNSLTPSQFDFVDASPENGYLNYYRLTEVDLDGNRTTFESWVVIDNTYGTPGSCHYYNLLGQPVPDNSKGLLLIEYPNGQRAKIYRQ